MRSTTLCFLVKGQPVHSILLGWKKTGFGRAKYNGFGGKIEAGETIVQAAVRELREECGVCVTGEKLENVGRLEFIFPAEPEFDHDVHIFLARIWQGEPQETVEMRPCWFTASDIPYKQMWADDIYWLPKILHGEKIAGTVVFQANNEDIAEVHIGRQS